MTSVKIYDVKYREDVYVDNYDIFKKDWVTKNGIPRTSWSVVARMMPKKGDGDELYTIRSFISYDTAMELLDGRKPMIQKKSKSRSSSRRRSPSRSASRSAPRRKSPSRSTSRRKSPSRSTSRRKSPSRSASRRKSPSRSASRRKSPSRSASRSASSRVRSASRK